MFSTHPVLRVILSFMLFWGLFQGYTVFYAVLGSFSGFYLLSTLFWGLFQDFNCLLRCFGVFASCKDSKKLSSSGETFAEV